MEIESFFLMDSYISLLVIAKAHIWFRQNEKKPFFAPPTKKFDAPIAQPQENSLGVWEGLRALDGGYKKCHFIT